MSQSGDHLTVWRLVTGCFAGGQDVSIPADTATSGRVRFAAQDNPVNQAENQAGAAGAWGLVNQSAMQVPPLTLSRRPLYRLEQLHPTGSWAK